ncbi:outer membrane porin GjpA [Mycolicibacterium sp. 624]|uniref:outer membrane porin GjpA n=1 Tax=Mycolicibacterium sp. 624 TaxID=3156314 RepID=UPI003392DDB0
MQLTVRPYVTAGIALVGASVIAATPITPLPDTQAARTAVSSASVQLSAMANPLQPWVNSFNTASANATRVADFYFKAPGAVLQQAIVNQVNYLGVLLNNPGHIGAVLNDIGTNLQNAFNAATFLGGTPADLKRWAADSNDAIHSLMWGALTGLTPHPAIPALNEPIRTVLQLLASPLTGVLMGLSGPFVSPVVAALNSIRAILTAPDIQTALQTLVAMPATVVGAFFNGASLNLDALVPLISASGIMPAGFNITSLGVELGGLFTSGATKSVAGVFQPGGSIFNSLTFVTQLGGSPLTVLGRAVGPLAALASLSQMIAKAIGWDGVGNPLAKLKFPQITGPSMLRSNVLAAAVDTAPTVDTVASLPSVNAQMVSLGAGSTPGVDAAAGQTPALAIEAPKVEVTPEPATPIEAEAPADVPTDVTETEPSEPSTTAPAEGETTDTDTDTGTGTGTGTDTDTTVTPVDTKDGNKVVPGVKAGANNKSGDRTQAGLKALGDQVGAAAKNFGDGIKKALGGNRSTSSANSSSTGGSNE